MQSRANIPANRGIPAKYAIFRPKSGMRKLARWWDLPPHVGAWSEAINSSAQSLAFLDAVERASRAAPLNRPVLVIGERGTGKELIAERLHHLSARWAGPLVTMNCAALPENLIEAELFGHEAGSFTGAAKTRHGRFEEADGGTLFLDELGDPVVAGAGPAAARGRIWRDHPHRRVEADPGRRPHRRRDQRASAAPGRPGPVPRRPARPAVRSRSSRCRRCASRKGDIPLLAEHFGRRMAVELEWANWPGFSDAAQSPCSKTIAWPGNVRELRNVVERAVYRHEDPERPIADIQFDPFQSPWVLGDERRRAARRRRPRRRAAPPARRRAAVRRPTTSAARSTPMKARCSRKRLAAIASTSAQPPPRSA